MSFQTVCGVDPGTEQSAIVEISIDSLAVISSRTVDNETLASEFRYRTDSPGRMLAIEMVASYGMPVGETTFETVLWVGRFIEAWNGEFEKLYRKKRAAFESVAMHLCGSTRAKDANIRQALLDKYQPIGGGKTPQVGTKAKPGPLYGVSGHEWSALAVAVTYAECCFINAKA